VKVLVVTPLVPHRRGHPLGSRNKRTLEAPTAAAAAESAGMAFAATVTAAPAGVVASAATNVAVPVGAPSITGLAVTPLEAVAAIVGPAILVGADPPGLIDIGIGGSSGTATAKARRPHRSPRRQRLSYVSEHGFTTFVVHLRAGCEARLPLPASFIGTKGRNPPDEHHGGRGQRRPAPVPHRDPSR
jgi:hypothetical protein